jgi:Pre-mRNA-splicing factor of RES complex
MCSKTGESCTLNNVPSNIHGAYMRRGTLTGTHLRPGASMDKEKRLDDKVRKLSGTPKTPPPSHINVPEEAKWDDPLRLIRNTQPPKYIPPNRFSIPPGPRWDGIDRSNGFEARWLFEQNARQAKREAAYRSDHINL